MKKNTLPILCVLVFIVSCHAPAADVEDNWTENQETHFYNDCVEKMKAQGETEDNADAFCECCLLAVKKKFSDGAQAMKGLTDAQIAAIEEECAR